MLSIKLIRSITSNRRAQQIGDAIGRTNHSAAIAYLEGAARRSKIEYDALLATNEVKFEGEKWIEKEWSTHYRNINKRKKAA